MEYCEKYKRSLLMFEKLKNINRRKFLNFCKLKRYYFYCIDGNIAVLLFKI